MKLKTITAAAALVMAAVTLVGAPPYGVAQRQPREAQSAVDAAGNLYVPQNYKEDLQFLGTWSVAADSAAGAKEMHVVYGSQGAAAAYRNSKDFSDGTVLVKEVFETQTGSMSTGTVSHVSRLKGWFVMVRDSKNLHPKNALWGDGWGWSWFNADNMKVTTTKSYRSECQGCHVPARASHWIYTNGYPDMQTSKK